VKSPAGFIFLAMWTQPALMSVGLTATALEIPFSNVLLAPAIAPDASLLFPAVACARSDAFPANNVAQTARAFPRQDASPNRARQSPLRPSPDRGTPFPAHALFFALPVPFASSARRSFEIFVDLPGASQSIDRADCSDSERGVAEAACGHSNLAGPAVAPLPIRSR